ncbi:DUF4340 domain-containing protein [Parahaliea mediterranea]|uniref:DUF4340 domain-containing protein n=1 Tax=Parahaliea mediterranea TaxID=651086 RepID=A0A939IIV5_9GAMM|nr:DUF4340 domain-containing protein [Parahaliea mediterranea]MBN7796994.1 DUF4340 domain-containing protein [Parahaliea mediterranea]
MKRTIVSLLFLLLVQCGLAALLYWPGNSDTGDARHLLDSRAALRVDAIRIADDRDNEVLLQNLHGRWVLPDLHNLPADHAHIQELIDTLTRPPRGFPVAESAAARQRFRVASYHYKRRLTFLGNGEALATIYLGRSPAYRAVYARSDSYPAIYRLQYNNHDAPATPDAWLDPGLLAIEGPRAIAIDGTQLRRDDQGRWRGAAGSAPEPRELAALLDALATLTVQGLADEDAQRSLAESGRAARRLRVEYNGQSILLELFRDGERYYVHDSRYPPFLSLSRRQYQRLMDIDIASLAPLIDTNN